MVATSSSWDGMTRTGGLFLCCTKRPGRARQGTGVWCWAWRARQGLPGRTGGAQQGTGSALVPCKVLGCQAGRTTRTVPAVGGRAIPRFYVQRRRRGPTKRGEMRRRRSNGRWAGGQREEATAPEVVRTWSQGKEEGTEREAWSRSPGATLFPSPEARQSVSLPATTYLRQARRRALPCESIIRTYGVRSTGTRKGLPPTPAQQALRPEALVVLDTPTSLAGPLSRGCTEPWKVHPRLQFGWSTFFFLLLGRRYQPGLTVMAAGDTRPRQRCKASTSREETEVAPAHSLSSFSSDCGCCPGTA